jgi:signal transduction histidine kinase/CheY-like chemotaxis protein
MITPEVAQAQRLRLRRTAFAIGGAAALTVVMLLLFLHGAVRLDAAGFLALHALFWAVNIAFLAVIRANLNLRLRDPGMTLAQMLWATLSTFVLLYFVDESRHLVLMVYLLAMMFGAFRLDVSRYLVVTVTALVLYAGVLAALDRWHPQLIDRRVEFINWLVFFVVMVGFSLLGGETSRLRAALQRRNDELSQARDAAATADQAKSRFLASTSHELRTPLNAILGACEIVDTSRLRAIEREALTGARHAGHHLLFLVNSMIDLSKLESGSLESRAAPIDLVDALENARDMMAPLAKARGIGFTLTVDAGVPRHVHGDAMRLNEVLVHLLNNAIKFTREGEVGLAAQPDPSGGARVLFSVTDTGAGLAPQRLAKLSRALAGEEQAQGAGSGLGLALCRQLVALMGGALSVASSEGVGTRFSFALPLPAAAPHAAAPPAAAADTGGAHVLIVDDSSDNRLLLRAFLGNTVARLDEADDGARGVAMFRERDYDLVLMDMHMPVMGGIEATRAMRAWEGQRGGAPATILALTADDSIDDRRRSTAAGCDDHLVKPVSKKKLLAAIAAHLERR